MFSQLSGTEASSSINNSPAPAGPYQEPHNQQYNTLPAKSFNPDRPSDPMQQQNITPLMGGHNQPSAPPPSYNDATTY